MMHRLSATGRSQECIESRFLVDPSALPPERADQASASVADGRFVLRGNLIKIARLRDEWYEDLSDPGAAMQRLETDGARADIFTFLQRLPEVEPKYPYYFEWDNVAAIRIHSFDYWWKKQCPKSTRNHVRKAEKRGVLTRIVEFDDALVRGISEIYNETRLRGARPFTHYGEDFETLKTSLATFLDRTDFIGAFYGEELIGFIKLVYSGVTGRTMHILSKVAHRDKCPANALLAKAVEICAAKEVNYLVFGQLEYGKSGRKGLSDFKRENGFTKVLLPRYYVPLNLKGKLAMKLKLHRGIVQLLPRGIVALLLGLRGNWYEAFDRLLFFGDST